MFLLYFFRRQLQKKRMSKGPNKIILTPSDFVFPQIGDNRRVSFLCIDIKNLVHRSHRKSLQIPSVLDIFFLSQQISTFEIFFSICFIKKGEKVKKGILKKSVRECE